MSKNDNAEGEDVVRSRIGGRDDYSSNAAAIIAVGGRSDGKSVATSTEVASSAEDNIIPMLSSGNNYSAARAGNLNSSYSLDGDSSTHTTSRPNINHPLHHTYSAVPMTNNINNNNDNNNYWNNNSPIKLFESSHESFLEKLAREECRHLPCREHRSTSVTNATDRRRRHSLDEEEERRVEEGRRFMLLEFSSDDDDVSSESEDDLSSSEEELEEVGDGSDHGDDMSADDVARDAHMDDEDSNNDEPGYGQHIRENARVYDVEADHSIRYDDDDDNNYNYMDSQETTCGGSSVQQQQHLKSAPLLLPLHVTHNQIIQNIRITNPNHQRMTLLLSSLANSEEEPLIRADIPWSAIIACGSLPQTNNLSLPLSKSNTILEETPAASALAASKGQQSEYNPRVLKQTSLLQTLYHQPVDPNGARLLQGVLRMDPPLKAVEVLFEAFPLSCLDMEGFFTACQFAHPNTSRVHAKERGGNCSEQKPRGNDHNTQPSGKIQTDLHDDDEKDDYDDHETDDVGEVVKLVMHQTIRARHINGVDWGMVAFLGDARINPSHAKLLLRSAPEALTDPKHGAFGVSPLDRMASGFFIHGERNAWVEKLRLALRVAAYVREKQRKQKQQQLLERKGEGSPSSSSSSRSKIVLPNGFFRSDCRLLRRRESYNADDGPDARRFHPYHELIRRIVSPTYQGNKFGRHGFLQTLKACTQSDPNAFLRPDDEGNLPIHIALREGRGTVLGVKGERRLIKYLLDMNGNVALCPEGGGSSSVDGKGRGRLPLRMSIENAWPVHDLIMNSALSTCRPSAKENGCQKNSSHEFQHGNGIEDYIASNMMLNRPLLHDALGGPYHPRFGIHGARRLFKTILTKIARHRHEHQNDRKSNNASESRQHHLTDFIDIRGRTALHVALENAWPVYDLIVRADPPCLEVRDPTQYGFFPFQTAACAFTACVPQLGREDASKATAKASEDAEMRRGSSEVKQGICSQPAIGSNEEAFVSQLNGSTNIASAAAGGAQEEASLMEMSMLFELIRESPLCVTWRMSNENSIQSDSRQNAEDGEGLTAASPRRSMKRRRPSSPPDKQDYS